MDAAVGTIQSQRTYFLETRLWHSAWTFQSSPFLFITKKETCEGLNPYCQDILRQVLVWCLHCASREDPKWFTVLPLVLKRKQRRNSTIKKQHKNNKNETWRHWLFEASRMKVERWCTSEPAGSGAIKAGLPTCDIKRAGCSPGPTH